MNRIELLQMLELTIISSHGHVVSQAFDEVRHRLVNSSSSSQVVCRETFNSSVVLGSSMAPHYDSPDVIVQ